VCCCMFHFSKRCNSVPVRCCRCRECWVIFLFCVDACSCARVCVCVCVFVWFGSSKHEGGELLPVGLLDSPSSSPRTRKLGLGRFQPTLVTSSDLDADAGLTSNDDELDDDIGAAAINIDSIVGDTTPSMLSRYYRAPASTPPAPSAMLAALPAPVASSSSCRRLQCRRTSS
jgi:hypothetical protein